MLSHSSSFLQLPPTPGVPPLCESLATGSTSAPILDHSPPKWPNSNCRRLLIVGTTLLLRSPSVEKPLQQIRRRFGFWPTNWAHHHGHGDGGIGGNSIDDERQHLLLIPNHPSKSMAKSRSSHDVFGHNPQRQKKQSGAAGKGAITMTKNGTRKKAS